MTETSYYRPLGQDRFLPTVATTSPWDAGSQHGGPVAALLARAIEQCEPDPDMAVTRLAVDFLGAAPQRELRVSARVVRPGRRVEMLEAELRIDGERTIALARGWRMRMRPGATAAGIDRDLPEIPAAQPTRYFPGLDDTWGYGRSIEWRFVQGSFEATGPAKVWTRVLLPLVDGEESTGLQRVCVVADSANGLSAELDYGQWLFVPTSLSLTIHRVMEGEWMLLDAESRIDQAGAGLTHAELADTAGPIGLVTQALFVDRRVP
ncbi:thioesterase family protein [Phytoactinopolyspora limicola]|uniref:thioesterase family protein n=1 Tax=Phytoactinopolyspora limicola TaxID=2715536 RepID=UPI00140783BD|nr:thioesterase family protein [Phytoactinopolyspora limicola]